MQYRKNHSQPPAVNNLSLSLCRGEVFGLVGESGCGKSTVGKAILQLVKPTSGSVKLNDLELTTLNGRRLREMRSKMQYIFQDPKSCLNPNKTIGWILEEPLLVHGIKNKKTRLAIVEEALETAGLSNAFLTRYPHELSGGQAQRIVIMSALILKPEFIVADEAVSALDVSVQAQILNFINDLKKKYALTIVFITHDLAVCHYMSDRIGVMYLGHLVELGNADAVYHRPKHPYTKLLFSSVMTLEGHSDDETERLRNETAHNLYSSELLKGCPFFTRCAFSKPECKLNLPPMVDIEGHCVRCYIYGK